MNTTMEHEFRDDRIYVRRTEQERARLTDRRCGLYARAARQGAASARQVADRFHLIQNLRLAIEQQLSYNYRSSKFSHNESSPTQDERSALQEHRQMVRIGRRNIRLEQFRRVKALHQPGLNLSRIVDETGLGWRTVAKWVTLNILPERRLMDPGRAIPPASKTSSRGSGMRAARMAANC